MLAPGKMAAPLSFNNQFIELNFKFKLDMYEQYIVSFIIHDEL